MKKQWQNFKKIFQLIWQMKPSLIFYSLGVSILTILLPYLTLWLSAFMINGIVAKKSFSTMFLEVLIFLGSILVGGLLKEWLETRQTIVLDAFNLEVEKATTLKLLDITYYQLQDPKIRENYQRAMDARNYNGGFYALIGESFLKVLNGLVALGVGLVSIWRLAQFSTTDPSTLGQWTNQGSFAFILILLIFIPIGFNLFIAKKQNEINKKGFDDNIRINNQAGYILNTIINYGNGPVLRLYEAGKTMMARYRRFLQETEKVYQWQMSRNAGLEAGNGLLVSLFSLSIYLMVVLKAYYGAIEVGSVLLYAGFFVQMTTALNTLFSSLVESFTLTEVLSFYFDFLNLEPEEKGSLPVEKRDDNQFEIEFSNVSFKYPGSSEWSLRHVSFKLVIGEKLAIVGRNGSGKSTLVKLLARLYPVTEGKITLNGIEIDKYDLTQYQHILAVVFQDFKLFSFSVAENVAASHQPDEDRVKKALYIAGVLERVKKMPKGIHTTLYKDIDEEGVEVSGGEAQKIAIARAWYRDAPFVILDEPTSALDPFSEFEVYRRFDELVEDKTSIYISHRMSSTKFATRIIVFEEGKIVEVGNHQDLLSQNGLYAELFKAQASYYTDKLEKEQVATLFS